MKLKLWLRGFLNGILFVLRGLLSVPKWYVAVLKKYAVFSGRAHRKEYWLFILFNTVVCLVLVFGLTALPSLPPAIAWWLLQRTGTFPGVLIDLESFFIAAYYRLPVILTVYGVAVMLPGLAVVVRRLHDIGRTGLLLLWGLPGLGLIWILRQLYDITGRVSPAWGLVPLGVFFLVILVLTTIRGTPGENRYGPDPTEELAAPVVIQKFNKRRKR